MFHTNYHVFGIGYDLGISFINSHIAYPSMVTVQNDNWFRHHVWVPNTHQVIQTTGHQNI